MPQIAALQFMKSEDVPLLALEQNGVKQPLKAFYAKGSGTGVQKSITEYTVWGKFKLR